MFHHGCNVLLQRARHLRGGKRAVHEPVRIGVIPYPAVSANFHAVSLYEAHDLSLAKVERTGALTHDPPLHSLLRFHHVEFASPAWPSKRLQKIARVEGLTPRASGLARPQVATKWRSLMGSGLRPEAGSADAAMEEALSNLFRRGLNRTLHLNVRQELL